MKLPTKAFTINTEITPGIDSIQYIHIGHEEWAKSTITDVTQSKLIKGNMSIECNYKHNRPKFAPLAFTFKKTRKGGGGQGQHI